MHRPPGSASPYQSCGDVDAVAVNVPILDNDVAEIDADPERDALVLWQAGIAVHHALLDFDGAADRLDRARELDQHAVAGRLHDPALVAPDRRVDQLSPVRLEARERGLLVRAHEP
jgi:hypothetical protein